MIDRETGRLDLGEGLAVSPSLSRTTFEQSVLGQVARLGVRNEPYLSYSLPSSSFEGRKVFATVTFKEQLLESVSILLSAEPDSASWTDWN